MKGKSLVSINDFTREEYITILDRAEEFEKNKFQNILNGKIIASLFFEPSTRTRLSFETAILRMGGKIIGFDSTASSIMKGETLYDTIKIITNYCDLIIIRHPLEGSARFASEIANVPVINAGDGANQHPTQTLLDLYSIRKTQNTLDNLKIAMVGDLKYGRTVHSLLFAMAKFKTTFYFVSPDELKMPDEYKMHLEQINLKYYEEKDLTKIIPEVDIIYMTRVQRERFSDVMEYERTKNAYVLKKEMIKNPKPNLKILHPLPRVNEIDKDVDESPHAYYFKQAENGIYIRQALIAEILGI